MQALRTAIRCPVTRATSVIMARKARKARKARTARKFESRNVLAIVGASLSRCDATHHPLGSHKFHMS